MLPDFSVFCPFVVCWVLLFCVVLFLIPGDFLRAYSYYNLVFV